MSTFRVHLSDRSFRDIDAATAQDARRKVTIELQAAADRRPVITKIKLVRTARGGEAEGRTGKQDKETTHAR